MANGDRTGGDHEHAAAQLAADGLQGLDQVGLPLVGGLELSNVRLGMAKVIKLRRRRA